MHIEIKFIDNSVFGLDVTPTMTINDVEHMVIEKKADPGAGFFFTNNGHYLQSDKTIKECKIKNDDTLTAMVTYI